MESNHSTAVNVRANLHIKLIYGLMRSCIPWSRNSNVPIVQRHSFTNINSFNIFVRIAKSDRTNVKNAEHNLQVPLTSNDTRICNMASIRERKKNYIVVQIVTKYSVIDVYLPNINEYTPASNHLNAISATKRSLRKVIARNICGFTRAKNHINVNCVPNNLHSQIAIGFICVIMLESNPSHANSVRKHFHALVIAVNTLNLTLNPHKRKKPSKAKAVQCVRLDLRGLNYI